MKYLCATSCLVAILFAVPGFAQTGDEFVSRGLDALKAHDAAKAMEYFDRALQADPRNRVAALQRGQMLLRMGEAKMAISDFTTVILADPVNAEAYDGRGQAKMMLKVADTGGALADFGRAIEVAPDQPMPLLVRASYLIQLRDRDGAQKDLERALPLASGSLAASIAEMLARLNTLH
jgi:tetratricopeptide (TPR) repeat protein